MFVHNDNNGQTVCKSHIGLLGGSHGWRNALVLRAWRGEGGLVWGGGFCLFTKLSSLLLPTMLTVTDVERGPTLGLKQAVDLQ